MGDGAAAAAAGLATEAMTRGTAVWVDLGHVGRVSERDLARVDAAIRDYLADRLSSTVRSGRATQANHRPTTRRSRRVAGRFATPDTCWMSQPEPCGTIAMVRRRSAIVAAYTNTSPAAARRASDATQWRVSCPSRSRSPAVTSGWISAPSSRHLSHGGGATGVSGGRVEAVRVAARASPHDALARRLGRAPPAAYRERLAHELAVIGRRG
jgi:hypothetical protein